MPLLTILFLKDERRSTLWAQLKKQVKAISAKHTLEPSSLGVTGLLAGSDQSTFKPLV